MKTIKQILESDDIIVAIGVFDPLSALTAQKTGFDVVHCPGWSLGAHLGVTEPLTTLTETVQIAGNICHVVDIPLSLDAGAGFGNASMIKRCVRSLEDVGVQAIHLEDQVVPKRLDYHQGKHFIISADEMMLKLDCALKARRSSDCLIVARTDAGRNKYESFDAAIERARLYATSGADMVKVFARDDEEVRAAPKKIDYPCWYVASEGLGRPIPTPREAKAMGYRGITYTQTALQAAYNAYSKVFRNIYETGRSGVSPEEATRLADEIMSLISINELAKFDPTM